MPGTRIRSPKVATITSFCRASSMKASISAWSVTHTGQPGPDRREMVSGRTDRIPLLKMETVCVPQTSIRRMGRRLVRRIFSAIGRDRPPSRYSSLCLIDIKPPRGNPKHEIRNPKQTEIFKTSNATGCGIVLDFGIRICVHCLDPH